MKPAQFDEILTLQLAVAWAGEADTRPPRLPWWRTAMCDPSAGEDLLRRLAPKTWPWATLETARAAARRVDDAARKRSEDPDHLLTLFRLGFEVDEHLDDRLRELKLAGTPPDEALPRLAGTTDAWSPEKFEAWLTDAEPARFTATATGRRLTGETPTDLVEVVRRLASVLLPLADTYPLPHFRVAR